MESLQRINLYVTYVEKEGPFIKLWGQADKSNALFVEQFLDGLSSQFDIGVGKVSTDSIPPGTLVCAKYKDNKYYRAKILNNAFVRDGSLEVSFIDFGNTGVVNSGAIRSLQNFPPSIITIAPLAVGFIFAEAHCVGGGEWNDTIFDSIAKEIKYREVVCTLLTQATNYYLVRISVEGTDLGSILLQRGLMQPISLQAQQAVLLSMSMQKSNAQSQNQTAASLTTQINTYKACTLEPGSLYPVYVSYVNDGPCHFFVQLKQTEDALVMLMNDINGITLKLLEDIPIPGTICLAKCIEDGNVCRAVVTNEVDTQFKVFYVDFGNYEVLPIDSLYQIPFKYVLPKVMAIRFALAGVEKPTVTLDMQVAFKKFVDNRLLHLKVLPSPTRTALPKCELWDPETKTSALGVVIRSAKHSYPEPVALMRGFSQPVKVSFVFSCNRFYIQLVNKESELDSLMNELQEICQIGDPMDLDSIKVGVPCCALFSADGLWYRSQIVEILDGNVKVRYIDYGNEESVPIDQLKSITGEVLTVLRPQAIESCLNGYQNMEPDAERDSLLEELILEGVFTMKVVEMLDRKALVDLFDSSNYNVASLLLDKLAAATSQISPVLAVQAGNKIEHRKSFSQQITNKEDRNYNTGREHKTWDKPNDRNERTEKSWRQDNRENKSYDKNTNETNDNDSWRQNNKGFSPNDRFDKYKRQDDTWNKTETTANNNANWENDSSQKSPNVSWENTNSTAAKDSWNTKGGKDDWGAPANNEDSRPRRNDYKSNRGGFNDRGGDRFGGKPREGGYQKREYRKDATEMDSSGSEKSFHKGPRSSSRIDRGRGGHNFDKPRNSYRDNKGGGGDSWNTTTNDDSWNVSAVTSSIDAAPATAVYVNYDVVGTEENVIISWFHNPGLFYCQQVNCQESFKALMEEICDFYKDKKPERVVQGAPIIALFDEDNVLYRARVIEVTGTQYKVHYVDFGNVSTVTKVYPIEKKFMDLPAQAIPCALDGIVPANDQWADPDSYSSYFNKDSFLCKFVNKDEEKTYVNILINSEDIGQLLVRDGLALSTTSTIPDIDIPLLLGQQFRATVKSVNNLSDIILALECGLAVGCTVHNLETATETFEDDLKALLEQAVIVYVDNILEDYRLEVTLYDTEGNKHVIVNPDDGAFDNVDVPCPMLVLRPVVYGYVPFADDASVFIQPSEYAELVSSLLDQLFEEYDGKEHENTIIPEEGMLYAVHSEDGNWYRGKVISFDDEKATVIYVDYGNSEDVAFVELRELELKFLDILTLSLQVTVGSGGESFIDKEVSANVYFGEAGWEGTVQLIESSSTGLVTQTESTDTGFATSSMENPVEVSTEVPISEEETVTAKRTAIGTPVFMSHIDSPNDFYLQFYETLEEVEALQADLQEMVSDMEELDNPAAGVLCAAPFSVDQHWYRAEVLDADEDITTVRFVDFGNTDVIDNSATKVKTLPSKLLTMAIYATRCSLKIQPVEEEWSSTALTVFEKLTVGDYLTAEFFEQDEKCTYVELYIDGVNIKDALLNENLAKVDTKSTEGKQTGFVSHLNSPSEFWIQLENCVEELEWIAEQLSNAESFAELEDLTPGTLCAALFPDDQMWYRARILSNTVAGIELLFIDYGNSCTSSSLRQLPEDLIMTAPLAMKCSLQKNEGIPTWSPEAAAKFTEISADGQTIFNVKKISTGETCVVQLLLNGQDVATMLLPTTEEGSIKEIVALENLSIEKEGGEIVDGVALEVLDGQEFGDEAKDKLEELNKQGTTRFQVEFVNEKTVRLYLDGKDIRSLLGPPKKALPNTNELTEDVSPLKQINETKDVSPLKYEEILDDDIQCSEINKNNDVLIQEEPLDHVETDLEVDTTTKDKINRSLNIKEEPIDYVEADLESDEENVSLNIQDPLQAQKVNDESLMDDVKIKEDETNIQDLLPSIEISSPESHLRVERIVEQLMDSVDANITIKEDEANVSSNIQESSSIQSSSQKNEDNSSQESPLKHEETSQAQEPIDYIEADTITIEDKLPLLEAARQNIEVNSSPESPLKHEETSQTPIDYIEADKITKEDKLPVLEAARQNIEDNSSPESLLKTEETAQATIDREEPIDHIKADIITKVDNLPLLDASRQNIEDNSSPESPLKPAETSQATIECIETDSISKEDKLPVVEAVLRNIEDSSSSDSSALEPIDQEEPIDYIEADTINQEDKQSVVDANRKIGENFSAESPSYYEKNTQAAIRQKEPIEDVLDIQDAVSNIQEPVDSASQKISSPGSSNIEPTVKESTYLEDPIDYVDTDLELETIIRNLPLNEGMDFSSDSGSQTGDEKRFSVENLSPKEDLLAKEVSSDSDIEEDFDSSDETNIKLQKIIPSIETLTPDVKDMLSPLVDASTSKKYIKVSTDIKHITPETICEEPKEIPMGTISSDENHTTIQGKAKKSNSGTEEKFVTDLKDSTNYITDLPSEVFEDIKDATPSVPKLIPEETEAYKENTVKLDEIEELKYTDILEKEETIFQENQEEANILNTSTNRTAVESQKKMLEIILLTDNDVLSSRLEEPNVFCKESEESNVVCKEPEESNVVVQKPEVSNVVVNEPKELDVVLKELEEPNTVLKESEESDIVSKEYEVYNAVLKETEEPNADLKEPEVSNVVLKETEESDVVSKKQEVSNAVLKETEEPIVALKETEEPIVALKEPEVSNVVCKESDESNVISNESSVVSDEPNIVSKELDETDLVSNEPKKSDVVSDEPNVVIKEPENPTVVCKEPKATKPKGKETSKEKSVKKEVPKGKSVPSDKAVPKTKSTPTRTSLCFPKDLGTKDKSKAAVSNAKSSPKKKESPEKVKSGESVREK